jgi:Pyruvate/2-oxoacid:ferredoxin oxidoreductase delta subunit
MMIEFGIEWALNQSDEFKVINNLTTPNSKIKVEQCWHFVPCITIKENEDTYAFNKKLAWCKTQVGD